MTDSDNYTDGTERDEVLQGAIDVWGEMLQIDIAIEELSELTTALARQQRGRNEPIAVVEEIADVQLCLDQLKRMYGPEEVQKIEQQKLERLSRRVEADRNE